MYVFIASGTITESSKNCCTVVGSLIECKNARGKFLGPLLNENTRSIYIMESNLTSLTPEDFGASPNVVNIEISNSEFSFPNHNGLFRMLHSLEDLKIEDCDVGDEVGAVFMENESLEWLSLRGNRITSISRRLVSNLTRLQELNLRDNNVSNIEDGALEYLQELRLLDLTDNALDIGSERVLSSRPDKCTVCRPRGSFDGCSAKEVEHCHAGLPFDRLWWRSPGLSVRLNGNPVCNKTSQLSETEPFEKPSRADMECSVQEENCFYHENRHLSLMEACGGKETKKNDKNEEVKKISMGILMVIVVACTSLGIIIGFVISKMVKKENHYLGRMYESTDFADSDMMLEETKLLTQSTVSPNHSPGDADNTSVHSAALEGDLETLKKLQEEGVDLTMKNGRGESPLWCAAFAGQHKVVQFLLKLNPEEVTSRNQNGDTPLHIAV